MRGPWLEQEKGRQGLRLFSLLLLISHPAGWGAVQGRFRSFECHDLGTEEEQYRKKVRSELRLKWK
jgi:hypothetical protein